jgi:hypothetical protein
MQGIIKYRKCKFFWYLFISSALILLLQAITYTRKQTLKRINRLVAKVARDCCNTSNLTIFLKFVSVTRCLFLSFSLNILILTQTKTLIKRLAISTVAYCFKGFLKSSFGFTPEHSSWWFGDQQESTRFH